MESVIGSFRSQATYDDVVHFKLFSTMLAICEGNQPVTDSLL